MGLSGVLVVICFYSQVLLLLPLGNVSMGVLPSVDLLPTLQVLSSTAEGVPPPVAASELTKHPELSLDDSLGSDKADLVYIADGLPPILKKLFQKIQNWQFINLPDLSPKSARGREEEQQFLQQYDGKVLLVQSIEHIRKAHEVPDILSWVETFATLVAVASQTDPKAVPDLMSYLVKVMRASKTKHNGWLDFDWAYRCKAAAKGDHCWSRHDSDLWDRYIITPHQTSISSPSVTRLAHGHGSRPSPYQRPSTAGPPNQWKKTVCFSHNFDKVCTRQAKGVPCLYTHICYLCGNPDHTQLGCPRQKDWQR